MRILGDPTRRVTRQKNWDVNHGRAETEEGNQRNAAGFTVTHEEGRRSHPVRPTVTYKEKNQAHIPQV